MSPPSRHVRGGTKASRPGRRITSPKELAERMARLAWQVRDVIASTSKLSIALHGTCAADAMPGMAAPAHAGQSADMLAQTLVYGLFAVRCAACAWQFQRHAAITVFPRTDPFLQRLFETITGPEVEQAPYAGLLTNLAQLLDDTDLDVVVAALGQRPGRQDPILHFYETFLAAYDPRLRKACGVYYTPEPIVSFMVRAVDDLLKTRFGVASGLAGKERRPGVLIIDPACGTGSFLSGVIGHVRDRFLQHNDAQTWSDYLRNSLLPRLHGFELLPVPYAVAHLQLGRQLTGQDLPPGSRRERCTPDFTSDLRLGVHLTNSFEDMADRVEHALHGRRSGIITVLSADAKMAVPTTTFEAFSQERDLPILVVLGNPPYRGISTSRGQWIARLLEDYRFVDGAPLGEKKVWLRNDYVQFIRFGQWAVQRAGSGILALVTDHSYLDSATFRGMRQNLLTTFDEIYVLNLHGNAKRRERAADGSKDENVFDIRQGIAINLFVKGRKKAACRVFYEDLWGSRQSKCARLAASSLETISWKCITPASPGFELVSVNREIRAEYNDGWLIKDVFPVGSCGIQTSRDQLVVAFREESLVRRLQSFLAHAKSDQEVRHEYFGDRSLGNYQPGDTREWRLDDARHSLRRNRAWPQAITPYAYRPFDERRLLYVDSMIDWPRRKVMRHLQQSNSALCIGRAGLVASGSWDLVFCVNKICDHNLFYRGSSVNFPLYLYSDGQLPQSERHDEDRLRPNLSSAFIEAVTETLKLPFVAGKRRERRRNVSPEDILYYAYAIFHSPTYRRRYAEFLKYDFPRLPLTADVELFRTLCSLGKKLVCSHLLDKKVPGRITFPIKGDNHIRQVRYIEPSRDRPQGRVWINLTQFFEGVPPVAWQFHIGGYQVCRKWLQDRKGRQLSDSEQARYRQIVAALSESSRLMHDIDAVIQEHGGWPIQRSRT